MRVVADVPHPKFKIQIFSFNEKYLLKIEAGPMEQTYKIPMDQINSENDVKNLLDEEFLQQIYDHFTNMFISFRDAKNRILNP
jgi:hypothetical protein